MKTKFKYFESLCKTYRYWFRKVEGQTEIKIQMKRKDMNKFREGLGKRATLLVDILEIGCGWYSVTCKDESNWELLFGTRTDGASAWIKELNLAHIGHLNANLPTVEIQYVKKIVQQPCDHAKLQRLVQKFVKR